jgi:hypothetical protein
LQTNAGFSQHYELQEPDANAFRLIKSTVCQDIFPEFKLSDALSAPPFSDQEVFRC